mgnify:CR=1 FL=1
MRIEYAYCAPHFIALCVEENKSGGEFKAIHWREFHADCVLNVETDDMNFFANANLVIEFIFKLVNGGLNSGTANSIGGLEFKQDGRACADQVPYHFCVIHQRGLARV